MLMIDILKDSRIIRTILSHSLLKIFDRAISTFYKSNSPGIPNSARLAVSYHPGGLSITIKKVGLQWWLGPHEKIRIFYIEW